MGDFLAKNFRELLWKNLRGSNLNGRILGRNLNLSDFVFEEGGDALNFSEILALKRGNVACFLVFRAV